MRCIQSGITGGRALEKKTLTTGEIASYCEVNFRTVIRWIKRGHLKAYQLPGRGDNRVVLEDFLAFLREHRMPIPDELDPAGKGEDEGKPRVLIVDDEESMAKTIERALRRAGYETQITLDGFQAGALVESYRPHLMTLDLRMPGLGGEDVVRFVRSQESLNELKILVVSALAQNDLDAALAAGADDALSKPFENKELVDKAGRLVGDLAPT